MRHMEALQTTIDVHEILIATKECTRISAQRVLCAESITCASETDESIALFFENFHI